MKYMGSKARYAKQILPIILADRMDGQWYVEPFVGGANMIDKVDGLRIGNDSNRYLIELLKSLRDGWSPPTTLSEEEYQHVRNNIELYDADYVGYVGIPCSYAAKWFGGYCRGSRPDGTPRDYIGEAYRNCMKQAPALKDINFSCGNYTDMHIPANSIVYCDPPYSSTTKYKGSFDHDVFWEWCDELVENGHTVFVSEYKAPSSWRVVWQQEVNSSLTRDTGAKRAIEKLYTKSRA